MKYNQLQTISPFIYNVSILKRIMKRLLPFFYLIFAFLLANSGCKPSALNCNCDEQTKDEAFTKVVEEDGITFSWTKSTKIEHNIPYNIVFESLDEPTKTLSKSFVYRQNESPRHKVYYKDDADFFAQNSLFRILKKVMPR